MSGNKRDLTITAAIMLLAIVAWMSRGSFSRYARDEFNIHITEESADTPLSFVVQIDTTVQGLTIYYPDTDSVVLRCFNRPAPDKDSLVVFCCAAAFTRYDRPHNNNHLNIAGDHVCSGEKQSGYPCKNNTGAVVFYDGKWKFVFNSYSNELDSSAVHNGSGFAQELLIHEGRQIKTIRPLSQVDQYRALCQVNQNLCIIDANENMSLNSFINSLLDFGVDEALYLDMGEWHYSWYREQLDKEAIYIHSDYKESATNWLLFYATHNIL